VPGANDDVLSRNRVLASLPAPVLQRLAPSFRLKRFEAGQVVCDVSETPTWAYFPLDCIVVFVALMSDGSTHGIGLVGSDGMVGHGIYLGRGAVRYRTLVQRTGTAAAIPAQALRQEFERSYDLRNTLLRYTQIWMAQTAQIAACNRAHSVHQQLCRWLLSTHDACSGESIRVTHEWIAGVLGVRRQGITAAANDLQKEGLIRVRRGRIEVVDRPRLERRCCECYGVIAEEASSLVPERAGE
jgi:CRP-like cAMP-binding protein